MKKNPFPTSDKDRYAIWEMLVDRDIKAFIGQDWSMVANDFVEENFMGIDAGRLGNPDGWRLSYPDLADYKAEWLRQAKLFSETEWAEGPTEALFRNTVLRDIDINDDSALVHKKFFGGITMKDGTFAPTEWQTLYRCRKVDGQWKIVGFTGYMPHFLGQKAVALLNGKRAPDQAVQHKTAGPYSPVLEVDSSKLVVISGQAAIDPEGNIIGDSIEDQAAYTLDNCQSQLVYAGCTLDDVFKVNVYLRDLDDWPRFNEVYKTYFKDPLPVRTAIGSGLLMTLLVEIEMWATKK